MIASSPTDIQPVLDVVAENAARLCDATDAQISPSVDGDFSQTVAPYGSMSRPREDSTSVPSTPWYAPLAERSSIGRRFMFMI